MLQRMRNNPQLRHRWNLVQRTSSATAILCKFLGNLLLPIVQIHRETPAVHWIRLEHLPMILKNGNRNDGEGRVEKDPYNLQQKQGPPPGRITKGSCRGSYCLSCVQLMGRARFIPITKVWWFTDYWGQFKRVLLLGLVYLLHSVGLVVWSTFLAQLIIQASIKLPSPACRPIT